MREDDHRTARQVFGDKSKPCPVCTLPMRPTDLVERARSGSWAHAFCAQTEPAASS